MAARGIASRGATSACIGTKNHLERGVSVGVFSGIASQRLADQSDNHLVVIFYNERN
ncbi:hypothetical protein REMIM1_PA00002 (plasmid) [Rhizobium etli bv. mimosae str. Mim1]|nr:hypothetical protein REMIM1_PA00002 [Rhizobium etli bv. mimosae str. Mim1]